MRATCLRRDPKARWTDRCPMPVLALSILTAWSAAGIAGPQLVAMMKDRYPGHSGLASFYSFATAICFLGTGLLLSFLFKERKTEGTYLETGKPGMDSNETR